MGESAYCAELVRQQDSDRYLTALFAPTGLRADLLALYAFNVEVASGRDAVSEPMLGHIRLQWWRDAIAQCFAGAPRHHQVVGPLAAAIDRHELPRALFDSLIDAREMDLADTPPDTLDHLVAYADASSGGLTQLALCILGGFDEPSQTAGRLVGSAWALTGLMRALPHQLRQGRCPLPRDLMVRHGVDEGAMRNMQPSTGVCEAVQEIRVKALKKITKSRTILPGKSGATLPALLLAALAEGYLARLSRLGHDPFDARNAAPLRMRSWRLMIRAWSGRH